MKRYIKGNNSVKAGVFYLQGNQVATQAIANRFEEIGRSPKDVIYLKAEYDKSSNSTKVVFTFMDDISNKGSMPKRYYALIGYEEYDEGNIDYIDDAGDGYSIADVVQTDSEYKAKEYFEDTYHMHLPTNVYSITPIDDDVYQEWRKGGSDAAIV